MGDCLCERLPLRGEENDGFAFGVAGELRGDREGLKAFVDGLRFEDHSFATAKGAVVDCAMTVMGEIAKVVGTNFNQAGHDGALQDAVIER